jgi:thiol:disulfide interchange protein
LPVQATGVNAHGTMRAWRALPGGPALSRCSGGATGEVASHGPSPFHSVVCMTRRAHILRTLVGAAACFAGAVDARAQEHPITLTATPTRATIRPGALLTVRVAARIPSGWHLYSVTQPAGGPVATSFSVLPAEHFRISGALGSPVPNLTPDPNFGIITEWYEDSATFRVPVRATVAVRGEQTLQVLAAYQTCNARYCLPPVEDTLPLAVTIAGEPIVSAPVSPTRPSPSPTVPVTPAPPATSDASPTASSTRSTSPAIEPSMAGAGSFALFLWLAATMGALALLTPCVFPMVPITVSYFSQREHSSRAGAIGNALLYAGGIVGAFSGIGLGASLLFGAGGLNRFAADPVLNLGIAVVFAGFALSLFGLVHIALPARLVNWLDAQARSSRLGRTSTTLLMGATFAITTLTCTAPFVGTLLVSTAQGDWRWPAAGLVMFSSVLALPFFVLALVPRALSRLPRSGTWMQTMKGTLGFIELAAAFKFLSNADLVLGWGVFTRSVVLASWCALGLALTAYLLGVRFGSPSGGRDRGVRAHRHVVPAVLATAVTVWLATGLRGARMGELESFLPPAGVRGSGVRDGGDELTWRLNDYAGALDQAKRERRLVLIDFTGYTCTNCRWMEANMFTEPDVQRELARFVRTRLFTDGRGPVYQQQQRFELRQFKTVALPLYAIVDEDGVTRATFLGMTRDAREFTRFLTSALETAP